MTDEEKKAIEHLTKKMEYHKERVLDTFVWLTLDEHYVRVLLNLVEKQDNRIKELESDKEIKDKTIKLIKNRIFLTAHECEEIKEIENRSVNKSFEDCVIEYFENLAKVNLQSNKENVDTEDFKQKYQCLWHLKSNKESGDENE